MKTNSIHLMMKKQIIIKNQEHFFKNRIHLIETSLKKYIKTKSSIIKDAIKYALLPGGKRFRPLLCLITAEMLGLSSKKVLPLCCAIEMIHNYSLIHDDLPAMDNDDYRRGRLTVHKKFGECVAILTGDALLTLAFEVLSELPKADKIIKTIAYATGVNGMIYGQTLDTLYQHKMLTQKIKYKKNINLVKKIHLNKTAKFFGAIMESVAILSNLSLDKIKKLKKIGLNIGLAFQIADDLTDEEKDINTLTFPKIYGREKTYMIMESLLNKAKKEIQYLFGKNTSLEFLIDKIFKKSTYDT